MHIDDCYQFVALNYIYINNHCKRAHRTGSTSVTFRLRYSPKEQVYKISAKFDRFWGLQAALKFKPHFGLKLVPRPQKSKFSKNEKITPRCSPKELVYKNSAKSNHFWGLQAAPKFSGRHTDTQQTDRQTDRHSQILAQLKLRIVMSLPQCP